MTLQEVKRMSRAQQIKEYNRAREIMRKRLKRSQSAGFIKKDELRLPPAISQVRSQNLRAYRGKKYENYKGFYEDLNGISQYFDLEFELVAISKKVERGVGGVKYYKRREQYRKQTLKDYGLGDYVVSSEEINNFFDFLDYLSAMEIPYYDSDQVFRFVREYDAIIKKEGLFTDAADYDRILGLYHEYEDRVLAGGHLRATGIY